jgi:hypothetical protein
MKSIIKENSESVLRGVVIKLKLCSETELLTSATSLNY